MNWINQAACRGMSAGLFYPEHGHHHEAKNALKVCASCLVRTECLEYALQNNERFGVWGGMSVNQRSRVASDRREQHS